MRQLLPWLKEQGYTCSFPKAQPGRTRAWPPVPYPRVRATPDGRFTTTG